MTVPYISQDDIIINLCSGRGHFNEQFGTQHTVLELLVSNPY
jgi:hypothetical protein